MLHSIAVTLSVTLAGFTPTSAQLDVDPVFRLAHPPLVSAAAFPRQGMALPHMIFVNEDRIPAEIGSVAVTREEILHTRQMSALGPAYFLSYAATAGRAFEPYDPLDYDVHEYHHEAMWTPTEEEARRCPLVRLRIGGGGSASVLPCYEVVRVGLGPAGD